MCEWILLEKLLRFLVFKKLVETRFDCHFFSIHRYAWAPVTHEAKLHPVEGVWRAGLHDRDWYTEVAEHRSYRLQTW